MVDTLKPCPWCNKTPSIVKEEPYYYIQCLNGECEVMMETYWEKTKKKVIKYWNTRASDAQIESLTAQLEEATAEITRLESDKKSLIEHTIRLEKSIRNETMI